MRDGLSIEAFAGAAGAPGFEVVEEDRAPAEERATVQELAAVNNPKLEDVGEAWLRHKMNEKALDYVNRRQRGVLRKTKKRSPLSQHMQAVLSRWQLLIDCIGNVRIGELGPTHFRKFKFYEWADREAAKRETARWHQQLMAAVKTIFNYSLRHYPDWAWPAGISERLRAYVPKKYKPGDANAEPMPPAVFRTLLARCDVWAATDPEQFDRGTQSGRARRLQAIRKRREGR